MLISDRGNRQQKDDSSPKGRAARDMHLYIYRDDGTLTTCLPRERGGECRAKMVCSADACGIFVDLRWPAARRGALHIVGECPSAFQPGPPRVSGRLSARQSVTFNRGLSYRTPPPAAKRSYGAATRDKGRGRDKERPRSRRPSVTKSSLWFFFPLLSLHASEVRNAPGRHGG